VTHKRVVVAVISIWVLSRFLPFDGVVDRYRQILAHFL